MNKYITVPVLLYSSYEANIMDKNPHELECIDCIRKLNPARIESYCEAIPLNEFSEDNKCWTTVVMESGDEFIVTLTLKEFELLLNKSIAYAFNNLWAAKIVNDPVQNEQLKKEIWPDIDKPTTEGQSPEIQ